MNTWDLEPLKKEEGFNALKQKTIKAALKFIKKWSKRDDWLKDATVLKKALDEYNYWEEDFGIFANEWLYYYLKQSLNQNDAKIKASYNKIYEEAIELQNKFQFFFLKLSKISKKDQENFLNSLSLSNYKHFLEKIFRSGLYVLSEKEEKIIALKAKVSHTNWSTMVSALLSKEERNILNDKKIKEKKNFSEIIELMSHRNKIVRDNSAKEFNNILKKYIDIGEHELNSILENKFINDKIRGYKRADESRFISDDINAEVVDSLVEAVGSNFHISKEFYKLKSKALGLKKLQYHERNLEVSKIEKKYDFSEAYSIVYKTFKNLDPDFSKVFKNLFESNQVDVFPKSGKRSGAFALTNGKNQPSFILLNYTNSLNDILTIAHEFGHVINFELSKKQKSLNYDFPMCLAETASTFFEDFVLENILENADDELKFSIQMMKLNSDVSTIFRQIAFYKFENDLHKNFREKGYLSKDEIGKLFSKNMKAYMGNYVDHPKESENWWLYVSHFRNFFYVYSYAFGLLVSKIFQSKVNENKDYMLKIKDFLSSGSLQSPKKQLSDLGIEINKIETWKIGIKETENLLEQTKALFKKIN